MWSVSNFLTTLIFARLLGPNEFGAYALAYTAWTIGLVAAREAFSQPFILLYAHLPGDGVRREARDSCAAVMAGGCLAGLLLAAAGLASGPSTVSGGLYLTLAPFAPFLLLQDHVRYLAFTAKKAHIAFLSDSAWMALQVGIVLSLRAGGHVTSTSVLVAWAVPGAASGALALVLLRVRPRFGRTVVQQTRNLLSLGRWTVVSGALNQTLSFAQLSLLAVVYDDAAVGAVRAIQSFFLPLALLSTAISTATLPALAASANRQDVARLARLVNKYNVALVVAASGYLVPLVVWRDWILMETLNDEFASYAQFVVPTAVYTLISIANSAPEAGLKALRQLRSLAAMLLVVGLLRLVITVVVGGQASVQTLLWALTALAAVWTAWLWILYRHRFRIWATSDATFDSGNTGAIRSEQ